MQIFHTLQKRQTYIIMQNNKVRIKILQELIRT